MAVIIIGVIIIIDEIPPNQIVAIAIAIFVGAIFPAHIIQQIASFNPAIAVIIDDIGRVSRTIEVTESDQAIRINIRKAGAQGRRNFTLIEPDVQIKIRVGIIDTRINDAHHGFG